mmetsp:Transcript_4202/g.4768  ORF Transcript_4202/g.4768 Transcript_4202/m.4768 type:complete len:578 (+) Transcript_4202:16-1749(+)
MSRMNIPIDGEVGGGVKKIGFSLIAKRKGKKQKQVITTASSSSTAAAAFDDPDDDDSRSEEDINTDIPKKSLIIPLQLDSRKSLQEQARTRRQKESNEVQQHPKVKIEQQNDNNSIRSNVNSNNAMLTHDEDRAAIQALQREAAASQGTGEDDSNINANNKRVIASSGDTFQRRDEDEQFQDDLDQLPPDISVKSQVYKSVPIGEFGAAMLRGMGWRGVNDNNNNNRNGKNAKNEPTTMPRPSRLGLGATPKMMASGDAPDTHSRRRPRRQDQAQREERLIRQQQEMERERQKQFALDKQRVLQIGSIVRVTVTDNDESRKRQRRAVIKKLTGVPGLNMILIKYEGEATATKVKKGNNELVERSDLEERPFHEAEEQIEKITKNNKNSSRSSDDRRRDKNTDRNMRDRYYDEKDRDHGLDRHKRRHDDLDKKRNNKKTRNNSSSSKRKESYHDSANTTSWLISNIRVRVISSKYGGSVYKEKGIVVDVTKKGVATLKMSNGQVINVAERHLETALPKVGGNSIILNGNQRFSKGRLLERDSKKNCGVVQVFEDMSVVTTSLDDMAEWCGPLDDDLEN